ncbi:hypothetical protein FHP25_24915 [Vineibacter terrae]|uniref:Uncharacterized protein n=1 Tax=Vineibacter terrae TaxID=2586908 RepID=A0A5C8PGR3_9HYPH|nr:hypothetical protein [Vineibacter terrae]TXL72540.1 hypothetical protein FHP25_24915 [Vineibacter terrae]
MTPPPSIQALIDAVPRVAVAAAAARLALWYGTPVVPTVEGKWRIRGCALSDDELVDRYRLKCARIWQGIG